MKELEFLAELYVEKQERSTYLLDEVKFSQFLVRRAIYDYEFFSICEYVLQKDFDMYKQYLTKSIEFMMKVYCMHPKKSDAISSHVTMTQWRRLLVSLAIGDYEISNKLANLMGDRFKSEKKNDNPFIKSIGYCLRDFVLKKDSSVLRERLLVFEVQCNKKGNLSYQAMVQVFRGLLEHNEELCNTGLVAVLKAHKKLIPKSDIDHRLLFVWAIGLANLIEEYEMKVTVPNSKVFPTELIKRNLKN